MRGRKSIGIVNDTDGWVEILSVLFHTESDNFGSSCFCTHVRNAERIPAFRVITGTSARTV